MEVNVRSIMKMKYVKIKAARVRHAEDVTQGSANTFVKTWGVNSEKIAPMLIGRM